MIVILLLSLALPPLSCIETMSTPTASSSFGPAPSGNSAEPASVGPLNPSSDAKGTLTDWLHAELQKTVRHLQFLETTTNVAWWWCTLLAVLAAAIALDHWLWVLPTFARYLFWLTGIGLSMFAKGRLPILGPRVEGKKEVRKLFDRPRSGRGGQDGRSRRP